MLNPCLLQNLYLINIPKPYSPFLFAFLHYQHFKALNPKQCTCLLQGRRSILRVAQSKCLGTEVATTPGRPGFGWGLQTEIQGLGFGGLGFRV